MKKIDISSMDLYPFSIRHCAKDYKQFTEMTSWCLEYFKYREHDWKINNTMSVTFRNKDDAIMFATL